MRRQEKDAAIKTFGAGAARKMLPSFTAGQRETCCPAQHAASVLDRFPHDSQPSPRTLIHPLISILRLIILFLGLVADPALAAVVPTTPTSPATPRDTAAGSTDAPSAAAVLKNEALAIAKEVAAAYPGDALSAALLGSAFYNTGQSAQAIVHLRRCLELNPSQIEAYEILARMAYERGEPEVSAKHCREALKRDPSNLEILNRLGRALLDLGEATEAIQQLREAARLHKSSAETHYLLGQALLQAGNAAEAKSSFLSAVALMPDHTQAAFGLFTACVRLGQKEESARFRERFQSLEASDRRALADRNSDQEVLTGLPLVRSTVARTLFGAGQIYQAHRRDAEAGRLFFRAAFLDPEPPPYRAALEASFLRRQSVAEGIGAFEKLTAEQPGNPWNHLFRGRLHARLQQIDEASQAFQKVQALAPQWPEGYRAMAELYLRARRHTDEALKLARKAVELSPIATHYHLLAAICAETGDRKGALDAMEKAVALEPNQAKYREFQRKLQESP